MIRGTTPTLEFELPFDTAELAAVWVTLAQNKAVLVDKPMEECELEGHILTVKLTQEETLRLQDGIITEIQIRGRFLSGDTVVSNIVRENTDRILKDGVI